jgi:hypothetical protein
MRAGCREFATPLCRRSKNATEMHQDAIRVSREFRDILGVNSVGDRKDIVDKYNRLLDNFARDRNVALKTLERLQKEEEPNQYEADRVALYATTAAGFRHRLLWSSSNVTRKRTERRAIF